uniref:Uncharacterized protein n=1 Tax=Kalanchoe fedtschenkoi TaxID=63787 RepID=A0A7N0THW6_KALFE
MITRSRTKVKASRPAPHRQRPGTQASQSGRVASTSTPFADADGDKHDNRKSKDNIEAADAGEESDSSSRPWLTPKGKRFRIPEIESCPAAPKKMRTSPPRKLKRSAPIAFFSPPELEFLLFLGVPSEKNISVV